jgi:hypothetical protein
VLFEVSVELIVSLVDDYLIGTSRFTMYELMQGGIAVSSASKAA